MSRFILNKGCLYSIVALVVAATAAPLALPQTISFKPASGSPVGVGKAPISVATGDFNNDGKQDFAAVSADDNTVSVFLSNGNGTFSPAPNSPFTVNGGFLSGSFPIAIAVGDFNGDGNLDLAITNLPRNILCDLSSLTGNICSAVTILLGDGHGSFQAANNIDPGGHLPTSVAVGDFNGDGHPDLVVTNFNDSSVSILLGDSSGTHFNQASNSPISVGARPTWVAVADFNGDGILDLAVSNADAGTVSILIGNNANGKGDGTFHAASGSPISVGLRPISLAIADLDGDGKLDLAVLDFTNSTVSILKGNGDGTFMTPVGYGVGGHPFSLVVADFNKDGKPDLAVANRLSNSVSILTGTGNGAFALTGSVSTGVSPQSLALGDFRGGLQSDLVAVNTTSSTASVLLNNTDIIPPTTLATPSPVPNANGWNNTNVSVSLVATDNPGGTGVKELHYTIGNASEIVIPAASTLINLTTQGVFSITFHAVDNAGNVEAAHTIIVQIDLTSPTITSSQTPAANGAGWNNTNVTVSFSCSDDFSGVDTCTAPIVVSTEGANQSVSGSATDRAGNSASTSRAINLDKTPPSLTMPTLASNYLLNSVITLTFGATDSLSGLSSMTATLNGNPVTSGSAVTLTHLATNTFTLSATDVAGNTSTQTATFAVVYKFTGFFPPISNDGSGVFKLGSTIPVKFQLGDAKGALVGTAVAHLTLQMLSNGTPIGTPIDATAPGNADIGDLFRFDGTQYIYNLSTKPLSTGMWQLQARLDDGTVHTVTLGTK
jgi:FG-GAP-like repeat